MGIEGIGKCTNGCVLCCVLWLSSSSSRHVTSRHLGLVGLLVHPVLLHVDGLQLSQPSPRLTLLIVRERGCVCVRGGGVRKGMMMVRGG